MRLIQNLNSCGSVLQSCARRAPLMCHPHPLSSAPAAACESALLAALWLLESTHSALRSPASLCLSSYIRHLQIFSPKARAALSRAACCPRGCAGVAACPPLHAQPFAPPHVALRCPLAATLPAARGQGHRQLAGHLCPPACSAGGGTGACLPQLDGGPPLRLQAHPDLPMHARGAQPSPMLLHANPPPAPPPSPPGHAG